jgi:hypothetical protein
MTDPKPPFTLQVGYDQKELLGGRWWQDRLQVAASLAAERAITGRPFSEPRQHLGGDVDRRSALKGLLAIGGIAVVGVGAAISVFSSGGSDRNSAPIDVDALELQRRRGLLAGGTAPAFAWPSPVDVDHAGKPLERAALLTQATDLRPSDARWQALFVPTLFQSFEAPDGKLLLDTFRLVHTEAMARAFAQGTAVRELMQMAEKPNEWLLVVDLPGPEAVAFAAGMAKGVTNIFTFGNWPHPQGVVPAHLNLAAAAYYREALQQVPADGPRAAALILDRNRLNPYANEPNRFDNRYQARLPTAAQLRGMGISRILYVVPENAPERELDDLNERFVEFRKAEIEVKMLGLKDLLPDPNAKPKPDTGSGASAGTSASGHPYYHSPFYWHGMPGYHGWFWNHYGWASRPYSVPAQRPPMSSFGSNWAPNRRDTSLSGLSRLGRTTTPGSGGSRSSSSGRSPGGSFGRTSGGGFSG